MFQKLRQIFVVKTILCPNKAHVKGENQLLEQNLKFKND